MAFFKTTHRRRRLRERMGLPISLRRRFWGKLKSRRTLKLVFLIGFSIDRGFRTIRRIFEFFG
jgi:hypothetical protein